MKEVALCLAVLWLASRLLSNVGARVLPGFATVDTGTIKEKVDMSRELIIQDALNDNNPRLQKNTKKLISLFILIIN